MVETHTRILGIAPYDGMRTAMEQAAQAYPNVELEVYTGDLEEGQAIVQRMAPTATTASSPARHRHPDPAGDRPAGGGYPYLGV